LAPRLALACCCLCASSARAADDVRRRVAVLEFRSGVERASDLAATIAERLRKTAALEIVDLDEARRREPRVDAGVAACAGDPACTARLGGQLDVDEVLLVAMSQLGDLVLTVQRIDVVAGRVTGAPVSAVLPPQGAIDGEQVDGWLKELYPPTVFKRYGYISIVASVEGAAVRIDNEVMGETPIEGRFKVAAPRTHNVRLTRKGRIGFAASIDVLPDATVEVRADLPEDKAAPPWYKRWYPWVIVGAVVAGAAIGIAIAEQPRADPNVSPGSCCVVR
jgi:hypothetical protein